MLNEIIQNDKLYYMNTFGDRFPVCFESGRGINLYDTEGNEYKDFFAGIAVNALGHSHPEFVKTLQNQAAKLLHTSSLYYIENQARLAKLLVKNSCADKVFLCSTGAEANEGAFKLAKIYFYKKEKPHKYEIITLKNSFHGRTLAAVAATGQEKYQKPYKPLTPGFKNVIINDINALKSAVTENTAAIVLEPIQGESGVYPLNPEYLRAVRNLCDENEIILIFDEVQTGMGRCGKLFCYENYGIEPDIFTLAKALGGGIPIGAVCAKEFVAKAFEPGDHGTTFGGNPFSSTAACAVFDILKKEHIVENAASVGKYLKEGLASINCFSEVRGMGLMLGADCENAAQIQQNLFLRRCLVGRAGNTLRILPPLIITKQDADYLLNLIKDAAK